MNKVNILIVEDDLILAEDLKFMLLGLGYQVCGRAANTREALTILEDHTPNLALLDIELKGGDDGIELAQIIREQYKIPYIFLTSHADKETLDRAKKVHPYGYLVKPYEEKNIFTTVEMALSNFANEARQKEEKEQEAGFVLNDSLFVRTGGMLVKLRFQDILYLEADANYTNVFTREKRFALRAILKDLEQKLTKYNFARIHKSYLINLEAIDAIDAQEVHIGQKRIPIGRSQHSWLVNHIKTL
ncbi:response regulator [Fulvivirga imtechensis AK7]|uniref:Response regulator n=1 Tax=Fulvivirga imtechensis AK7 TaxID=1237149 RepID=L8K1S9_9BACT|nr:response regulator [Fulvivirga imtechensis]ELR73412.1 response regulator [Fulvivirga imtechensis AK7]